MKKILVTGAAGFIGFHLVNRLLHEGWEVVGLDNINHYYDPMLKFNRLKACGIEPEKLKVNKPVSSSLHKNYRFIQADITDRNTINTLFHKESFDLVCHLAAQAGVRYSLENPHSYTDSNITGFLNILEAVRHHHTSHLVYASSSSVYGLNAQLPLSEHAGVDHPVSLYAATKRSNELMAHTYSHLFGIPTTGLRFFTVYGPWGRPDMALFLFTRAILNDEPVVLYNHGDMLRDFTYVDDIVEGVLRVLSSPQKREPGGQSGSLTDPAVSTAPFRIYNIGNANPVQLEAFVDAIEARLGKKARREYMPLQPGDVVKTFSDVSDLKTDFDYKPQIDVKEGIGRFIDWYLNYFQIKY